MSRSGYTEDHDDNWALIKWRGQVASAIRGKRGQAFLKELIEALDTMPEKRLIAWELRKDGQVCALGALGVKRGVDLESLDPYDYDTLSATFGVAHQLVQEIEWINDEVGRAPEHRWQTVRDWACKQLLTTRTDPPREDAT